MAQQAAGAPSKASVPRRVGGVNRGRGLTAFLYLAPAVIGILLINIYPILYTIYTSLTNRNGPARFPEGKYRVTTNENIPWLPDFANYQRLLFDDGFYIVFGKSLLYAAICVFFFFTVGLIFALILNNPYIKGRGIIRTLMILPWAVPFWITALIWRFLFHEQFGPINQILRSIGLPGVGWLQNGTTAFIAITVVNIWLSYPFFMLILLGGLQSIPDDIYEAADLDGASYWSKLFSLTIPLLRPVALPAIILSVITTLKIFETIWLMTRGGPYALPGQPGATELLIVWAYNQGFQGGNLRFGLVAAFSIIVFVLLVGLTLIYSRITNATKAVYE